MIHTHSPHAVTNDSITKQHGLHCHFFHKTFEWDSAVFILGWGVGGGSQ